MFTWATAVWGWVTANAAVLSALTSVGMLLIWGVYLQLLLHNFRTQRRPQVIINRGRGSDINALCLISNMSSEAVFIETLFARLNTSKGCWMSDVTDVLDQQGQSSRRGGEDAAETLSNVTRQGPMGAGEYMEAGVFGTLLQQIAREQGITLDENFCTSDSDIELHSLEVGVIAIFGTESGPIGAVRKFNLEWDDHGSIQLKPDTRVTRQLRSRKGRHEVRRLQTALS